VSSDQIKTIIHNRGSRWLLKLSVIRFTKYRNTKKCTTDYPFSR